MSTTNKGFTIIELLVVIIIVGILSAIALPSLLSFRAKSREAEARAYISRLNRAQQENYVAKEEFAGPDRIFAVAGIVSETSNYRYRVVGDILSAMTAQAQPINGANDLARAHIGHVSTIILNGSPETGSILCQANFSPSGGGALGEEEGVVAVNELFCPEGYKELN